MSNDRKGLTAAFRMQFQTNRLSSSGSTDMPYENGLNNGVIARAIGAVRTSTGFSMMSFNSYQMVSYIIFVSREETAPFEYVYSRQI